MQKPVKDTKDSEIILVTEETEAFILLEQTNTMQPKSL